MIRTDGKPTIAWADLVTGEAQVDEWNAQVDHALEFGKKLAATVSLVEGTTSGIPAVSLLDEPVKGCFIAHTRDGATYVVEFTRCPD